MTTPPAPKYLSPSQTSHRGGLRKRLEENEIYIPRHMAGIDGLGSEARAVFNCSKLSGNGPQEAILKIRMQYGRLSLPSLPPSLPLCKRSLSHPWGKTNGEAATSGSILEGWMICLHQFWDRWHLQLAGLTACKDTSARHCW